MYILATSHWHFPSFHIHKITEDENTPDSFSVIFMVLQCRLQKIWRTTTRNGMKNLKGTRWWKSTRDGNTWRHLMRRAGGKKRSTMRRWRRNMPITLKSITPWVDTYQLLFTFVILLRICSCLSDVLVCRVARINSKKCGKKLMALTLKILTPKHSSICMVKYFLIA